jgi:hypothetical protein
MAFLGALATMCCVAVSLCAFSAMLLKPNSLDGAVPRPALIEVDDCSRTQPVLALAILDQGLQRETLLDNPKAYGSVPYRLSALPASSALCLPCCRPAFVLRGLASGKYASSIVLNRVLKRASMNCSLGIVRLRSPCVCPLTD